MAKKNPRRASSSGHVNTQDQNRNVSTGPSSSSVPEDCAPSATLMASQERPKSRNTRAIKKKRGKCKTLGIWKISFELFEHHEGGQDYILATHEIEKDKKNTYHLSLVKCQQKWAVKVKKISPQSNLTPVSEILNSPFQPEYNFPLQERLKGWKVKKKGRNRTKAWDKYYIHESNPQEFRSLGEVAIFILYNCRREHLENVKDMVEEAQCNSPKSNGEHEEIPQQEEIEKSKDVDAQDSEIYSWVLANPIIHLDPIDP